MKAIRKSRVHLLAEALILKETPSQQDVIATSMGAAVTATGYLGPP